MLKKIVAFVVCFQMVAVQTQIAFGNAELVKSTQEYQSLLERIENKIAAKLEGQSDEQLSRLGYKVYKLGVRSRNRIHRWSEAKFQRKLSRLQARVAEDTESEESVSNDEMEGLQEITSLDSTFSDMQIAEGAQPISIQKTDFLQRMDQVLISLGSKEKSSGKLSITDSETFRRSLQTENAKLSSHQLRSPASLNTLAKVLVGLLIVIGAITVIVFVAAFFTAIILYPILWLSLAFSVSYGFVTVWIRL